MKLRSTLLTLVALCGAGSTWAGKPYTPTTADDTALAATQIRVQFAFGPTSNPLVTCPFPTTYMGTPVCASLATFNVPSGFRFVITNISGSATYNPNGGEVMSQSAAIVLGLNATDYSSAIPFGQPQQVGTTSYFSFNHAVHMFADPGTGFPEVLISNLTGGFPFFQTGSGFVSITFQGYLVPTT
jgi:hypothetical protein